MREGIPLKTSPRGPNRDRISEAANRPATTAKIGSSTVSVVHCGGDVEFTDGEVEHGD